jgi:hypothetical protein
MKAMTPPRCSINEHLGGSIYREIKGHYYNVCNSLVQLLHSNIVQSRGHYGSLIFTTISVPNQS